MPTSSEPAASAAAQAEAEIWAGLIDAEPDGWDDVPPTELATVTFFDPAEDLATRAARWSHTLPDQRLGPLAAFAAGLAIAEAEAWERDEPHVATRAFEDRRFLLSDRIIHWAVPWLDAVAHASDDSREAALEHREALLELGDRHRVAPTLTGAEGTVPPGHDAIGPLDFPAALGTVPAGLVLLRADREALGAMERDPRRVTEIDPALARRLADAHEDAAARWRGVGWLHGGSERLWTDLAERADRTADMLRGTAG